MLFKNPVRTSKRTPHFTVTKINWLTLFKEIIAVYSQNHKVPVSRTTLCGENAELMNVKVCGAYSYHCALNDEYNEEEPVSDMRCRNLQDDTSQDFKQVAAG
jgi:hypothetical protein